MRFASKRAWEQARRRYARARMHYRRSTPPAVWIGPAETRDEILVRARTLLERTMEMRRSSAHPPSIHRRREVLREVSILRAAAMTRQPVDPQGRAFYVSIKAGPRHAFLYGPFPTQREALHALPLARSLAQEKYPRESAFAAFGTCSIARADAMPGVLNAFLPAIAALDVAGAA